MKVRKGDQVKIVSGNDKGKRGKVIAVFPKAGKVLVGGVNVRKRHAKSKRAGQKGEVINVPAPFALSKIVVVCGRCGNGGRLGYRIEDARKLRICKKCGGEA